HLGGEALIFFMRGGAARRMRAAPQRDDSGGGCHWPSRRYRWTAKGRKRARMAAGQSSAAATACCSIQYPLATSGDWNSSRIAAAVEETGFQAAIAPSQPGMKSGGANTEEIMTNGNASANRLPATSVFLMSSPR